MSRDRRGHLMRALHGWGVAVAIAQFMNGSIETSLTPHYPALAARMHVGPAGLGLALAMFPLGLFAGSPLGGWIAHRCGSRFGLLTGATLFFGIPPLAGLAPTTVWFATALLLTAIGNGIFDVAWGLQATGFEHHHRHDEDLRDANLGFQALFSLGSLVGVGSAAIALWLGWATFPHMLGVALVALAAVFLTARSLPSRPELDAGQDANGASEDQAGEPETETASSGWLPFIGLCVASFLNFMPIGAAYAWSTPYLLGLGAPAWLATFGLIAYTLFEAVGRRATQKSRYLKARSRRAIVVGGSLTALAGAMLIVVPGRLVAAIIGFGLVPLGLGPIGPIMQSVTNRTAQARHRVLRMTMFTTATYAGGVVGQPLIGWIAGLTSLRVSLASVGVVAVLVLALSWTVREPAGRSRG